MANENNQYIDVPEARNSKEIRDSIKLMGAKWDNFNKAWFYRKDDEQAVNNFKTFKHLDLDTIKATNAQKQENNNQNIDVPEARQYIDVDLREYSNKSQIEEMLKSRGAKFDSQNEAWFYRKDDEQASNNFSGFKHSDLDTIKAINAQREKYADESKLDLQKVFEEGHWEEKGVHPKTIKKFAENYDSYESAARAKGKEWDPQNRAWISKSQNKAQTNSDRKYIDVPNAQKDVNLRNLIKKCGAKWDPQNKAWFYNPNDKLADQMLSQFKEIKNLSQNNAQTPQQSTQKKSFTNSVGNFFKNHFSRKPTAEPQQPTNTDTVLSQPQLHAPTTPNFDLGSKMKEQKESRTYLVTDNLYNKEEERTALKNAGAEYDYFNKAWYYRDSNVKDQSVLDQYPKTTLADIRSKNSAKKDQSLDQKQVQQQNKKQTKSRSR